MQSADVHFIHIGLKAFLHQAAGNARNKLVGSLLGERGHKQLLRLDALVRHKMHYALNKRERFASSWTSNNQHGAFVMEDDGLLLVCGAKVHNISRCCLLAV